MKRGAAARRARKRVEQRFKRVQRLKIIRVNHDPVASRRHKDVGRHILRRISAVGGGGLPFLVGVLRRGAARGLSLNGRLTHREEPRTCGRVFLVLVGGRRRIAPRRRRGSPALAGGQGASRVLRWTFLHLRLPLFNTACGWPRSARPAERARLETVCGCLRRRIVPRPHRAEQRELGRRDDPNSIGPQPRPDLLDLLQGGSGGGGVDGQHPQVAPSLRGRRPRVEPLPHVLKQVVNQLDLRRRAPHHHLRRLNGGIHHRGRRAGAEHLVDEQYRRRRVDAPQWDDFQPMGTLLHFGDRRLDRPVLRRSSEGNDAAGAAINLQAHHLVAYKKRLQDAQHRVRIGRRNRVRHELRRLDGHSLLAGSDVAVHLLDDLLQQGDLFRGSGGEHHPPEWIGGNANRTVLGRVAVGRDVEQRPGHDQDLVGRGDAESERLQRFFVGRGRLFEQLDHVSHGPQPAPGFDRQDLLHLGHHDQGPDGAQKLPDLRFGLLCVHLLERETSLGDFILPARIQFTQRNLGHQLADQVPVNLVFQVDDQQHLVAADKRVALDQENAIHQINGLIAREAPRVVRVVERPGRDNIQ